jgi:hypothetical protein
VNKSFHPVGAFLDRNDDDRNDDDNDDDDDGERALGRPPVGVALSSLGVQLPVAEIDCTGRVKPVPHPYPTVTLTLALTLALTF